MADEVVIPQLPEHNGQVPIGVVTSFTGTSSRLTRALQTGDEGLALVTFRCKEDGHREVTDGEHRIQKLKATDLFILDGDLAADGNRLLNKAKKQASALDDALQSRAPLPGINDDEEPDDPDEDEAARKLRDAGLGS